MDLILRTSSQLPAILRSFRKRARLTQAALAKKLGVTQQAVSDLERSPEAASVERLLHVLTVLNAELVLRERTAAGIAEW